MLVIAVKHFNIDARLRRSSRDFSELTRCSLVQSLNEYVSLCQNADAGCLHGAASGGFILEEKVCDSLAIDQHALPPSMLKPVRPGASPRSAKAPVHGITSLLHVAKEFELRYDELAFVGFPPKPPFVLYFLSRGRIGRAISE